MIKLSRKRILVDGAPQLIFSGEVHYFRVARDQWRQRIRALRQAGANALASYIPWIFHELPDGSCDLDGHTRPERDLAAFIDAVAAEGLWFIARPGPFNMAELKNEGLPFRLYTDHPKIIPVGWDGAPAPSRTVDYLAPSFLAEVERWYVAVLPIIAARLASRGGPVIAVQLDNEVGMLDWVTNTPSLTDSLLADFASWLSDRDPEASHRYGADLADPVSRARLLRSPGDQIVGELRVDLGEFMRHRYARYVDALAQMSARFGIEGVPLAINIHGTEQRLGGTTFPIGISQLVRAYPGRSNMFAGSDHYLGDASVNALTDLYVMNAFMDAVNGPDQPLTSLEFEAGTGDYSADHGAESDPAAVQLKTRLSLAQGNRLINYYLFAGGINPPLDRPVGDGNDRISFTGERHGLGAPVGPAGEIGRTYRPTAAVIQAGRVNADWLADMVEEHDQVTLGFVLDHYVTEYAYPPSERWQQIKSDIEMHRGAGAHRTLARAMLLDGYRFGALDVEGQALTPADSPVLALASGTHLPHVVQRKLVEYLRAGGKLMLYGLLPTHDEADRPCTLLAQALGITAGEVVGERVDHFPSLRAVGPFASHAELRVTELQLLQPSRGTPLLEDVNTGRTVGVEVEVDAGRAIVIAAAIGPEREVVTAALARLGAAPGLRRLDSAHAVFSTSTIAPDGGRLLHALNASGYEARLRFEEAGSQLFAGEQIVVPPRTGMMLPLDLATPFGRIRWSTAEIAGVEPNRLLLRSPAGRIALEVETDEQLPAALATSASATVRRLDGALRIDADVIELAIWWC